MAELVAFGELIIDFAPKGQDEQGYPLLQAQAGGAPANVLSAFCRYSGTGAMISKVGRDAFGRLMINSVKSMGADAGGIVADKDYFTTLAFVTLDENGDRQFSFARKPGADTQLRFEEVDLSLIDNCKIFHFGSLSFTHYPARDTAFKLLEYAKSKGKIISYDPNLRLNLWENREVAKRYMLAGLEYADIVKISDNEMDFLFGCDIETGAKIILDRYKAGLVYVTLGEKGCYYANKKVNGYVAAPAGIQAVDTTGAGDIFGGSALSRFNLLGKAPGELTKEELENICRFAVTAASLSTLKNGGFTSVPDINKVNTIIEQTFFDI